MLLTREIMLSLPRPTEAQWAAFEQLIPSEHSWYKSSLLTGNTFVVFLSPDAGAEWDLEFSRNAGRSQRLYREKHGHLSYECIAIGEDLCDEDQPALDLPADLVRLCSFRFYPWGASDGAGLEVICSDYHEVVYDDWTKLEAKIHHPARERLLLLRRMYGEDEDKAWELYNQMSDEETSKVGRALRQLRHWLYGE